MNFALTCYALSREAAISIFIVYGLTRPWEWTHELPH